MRLSDYERAMLSGDIGAPADRMAMEIVTRAGEMLGAGDLVEVVSAHIDGCLYHGDSGVLFCERLVGDGAMVRVPTTTNVGALNLLKPEQSRLPDHERRMAFRLMVAHERMGCRPSWTCAPYQAGARPNCGQQIAWGESNAVAFANTVLGARTNRYGDFLDIACAITGRAPNYGLHIEENRRARLVLDASGLSPELVTQEAFYPVLGALIGRLAGETVAVVDGLPREIDEDRLKAMCAGAASTGAVALIHVVGVTPEAELLEHALQGHSPDATIRLTPEMICQVRDGLNLAVDGPIDSVALGSPHFSEAECRELYRLAGDKAFAVPIFVCTGRQTMQVLEKDGVAAKMTALGIEFVTDTCVVVTPILPERPGVMMTNSAKFAHYASGNTGHLPVFGTLRECVLSASAGRVVRDPEAWA